MEYRLWLLGIVAANMVLCVLVEDVFVEFVIFRWLRKK
jgi:hypothetical protein